MIDYRRIRDDLCALGLLAAIVFVGMSLSSYDSADPPARNVYPERDHVANWCGPVGARVAHAAFSVFGWGAWFVLLAMVSIDVHLFSRRDGEHRLVRFTGGLLLLLSICVGAQVLIPGVWSGPVYGSGGYVGALGSTVLRREFSAMGSLTLLASMLAAGLILTSDTFLFRATAWLVLRPLRVIGGWWSRRRERLTARRAEQAARAAFEAEAEAARRSLEDTADLLDATADEVVDETYGLADEPSRDEIKINPPVMLPRVDPPVRIVEASAPNVVPTYLLPGCDLLEEPEEFPYELLAAKARVAAETLERTFKEFGLNVKVVEIDTGPVITQFELELEKGLRLSKVTALADDLAIALRVPAVRVVAPIPGKNTVGVEVPNEKQVMVRLRDLIETLGDESDKRRVPMFLGKDVSGRPVVVDLTKMPHLLIAGRTGTGKSVCLNSLILSILMTRTPDDVKMLMIDPKMVELSPYRRVPHLMHPVITDMKKAEAALAWAVEKMEERYSLLARVGVRHLDSYNQLGKEEVLDRLGIDAESPEADEIPASMPYIIIIADEMADMMMTSGKDVEGHIIRLAQKSRAVGIHLVLATQKPTVDVITGLIKSNLPSRIAFQVASRVDSRVVLDEMGAERLLGNGDMLYLAPGTSNLTRAQGTYVSDHEVNQVIEFYSQYEPQYSEELKQLGKNTAGSGPGGGSDRLQDDMYEAAIDVVVREGRGSVSLLQRALGIGYGRAARLIDYMAEDGIVGEYNGSQARDVVYTPEQWDAMKSEREMANA